MLTAESILALANFRNVFGSSAFSLTAVYVLVLTRININITAKTRNCSRFELFGNSEQLRLSLQIWVWPRFDGLGQKPVKSQCGLNGVGMELNYVG